MSLAYLLVGIVSALIMFAGDLILFVFSITGTFMDFLDWFTSSLDIGSSANGYTNGGLIFIIACVIGILSLSDIILSIVSFILSKVSKKPFIACMVTYGLNFVLMFISSVLSFVCTGWQAKNIFLLAPGILGYAWPILGVLFWISMTVLAVLNIFKMKKELS